MLSKQHLHPSILIKSTLLFYSANVLTYTLHELSHAFMAYFLQVPATLFHFYADINQNEAAESDRLLIALTGPVFSLIVGSLCYLFYNKSSSLTTRLFLLYSATLSISVFFGNLFSASRVGDFSTVTKLLQFSTSTRYILSAVGLLGLLLNMFIAGRKLLKTAVFDGNQKASVILNLILFPLFLGTALVILTYTPLPSHFVTGIIASSTFWIFSLPGAATGKTVVYHSPRIHVSLIDVVLFLVSVLAVRILVTGIAFNP